jgi:hypothetical protein
MSTKLLRRGIQRIAAFPDYLSWYFSRKSHESVYFYTFHKCASILFGSYILKNIDGLRHVNHASRIYSGRSYKKLKLEAKGYAYGPIRLSADPMSPVYKKLVVPATQPEFMGDKIVIFFVRDLRDILVSAYYSFGYSHAFSPVEKIRQLQEATRSEIQAESLDEDALRSANKVRQNFETLSQLDSVCERSIVLKYEDMIGNFEHFIAQLSKYIALSQGVVQTIFERSRPKESEDISSHRRSGQPGGFRGKLQQETLDSLNRELENVLEKYQYEA